MIASRGPRDHPFTYDDYRSINALHKNFPRDSKWDDLTFNSLELRAASSTTSEVNDDELHEGDNFDQKYPLEGASSTEGNVTPVDVERLSSSSSFNRRSRFSQSMFSREHEMNPQQENGRKFTQFEYTERRASLIRREKEITRVTTEALKHVDDVIEKTQQLQEKDDEISYWKAEVNDLNEEVLRLEHLLKEAEFQLEEKTRFSEELQRQLLETRQKIAESRMNADKYKMQSAAIEEGGLGVSKYQYEQIQQQLKEALEDFSTAENRCIELQEANVRLSRDVERIKERNDTLFTSLCCLQKDRRLRYQDDDDDDALQSTYEPRTKRELLLEIRRLMSDRVAWQNYSSTLLRRIMAEEPRILRCERPKQFVGSSTEATASSWETYALRLTSHIMEHAPYLLNDFPTISSTTNQSEEVNSEQTAVRLV